MVNLTESPDLLSLTNVSLQNPVFANLLTGLQGNILKHHGRTHAFHLFIQFNPEMIQQAKAWIAQFAASKITKAKKQLEDAVERDRDEDFDGGVFYNFSLSFSGYNKLGINPMDIPDADPAFTAGMKNRTNITADTIAKWDAAFNQPIDALIIIADAGISNVLREKDNIVSQIRTFATVVYEQKGKVLRNSHGLGIEHFGYADGVSQPDFLKPANPAVKQWDDGGALLNTLLVKEPGTGENFGSYFVFRKLEQNVLKFKTSEQDKALLPSVKNRKGTDNEELAGAMIVGRFEDGTEVINDSDERGIKTEKDLFNDFDYRDDTHGSKTNGSKCPFHAHIRITNPRADVGAFAKQVRLTRRGIPFNDIGRDEFDLEKDQPEGGVGLLFMCYQSSIENQFEFIQQRWANHGDIDGRLVGQDAIIGQGSNATPKSLPAQWGTDANHTNISPAFKDFVTTKGGEYFFTPSIPFLTALSNVPIT